MICGWCKKKRARMPPGDLQENFKIDPPGLCGSCLEFLQDLLRKYKRVWKREGDLRGVYPSGSRSVYLRNDHQEGYF